MITTEECLLNRNRNPELGRDEIEALLKRYLAVDVVIWLGKGVHLDETDGAAARKSGCASSSRGWTRPSPRAGGNQSSFATVRRARSWTSASGKRFD